eukprot:1144262-Pelagomonas_calceolata.AAC.3
MKPSSTFRGKWTTRAHKEAGSGWATIRKCVLHFLSHRQGKQSSPPMGGMDHESTQGGWFRTG